MSKSGKLKVNSQPGLKQILWNVLFPEHETWRKSMWKKAKNFILPCLFGRIRPSNGFLLPLSVCVCFFQVKGIREVGGYNQLIHLYSTWGEFHPFLYPGYSHKSQTDHSEHWFHDSVLLLLDEGPFPRRSLPVFHHLTTVGSEVQHTESSTLWMQWKVHVKCHLPCYKSAKRRDLCSSACTKILSVQHHAGDSQRIVVYSSLPKKCMPSSFSSPRYNIRQFWKYFIYYIQRVTLPTQ